MTTHTPYRPLPRDDVLAVKRAFRTLKIASPITVARDGVEALDTCWRVVEMP